MDYTIKLSRAQEKELKQEAGSHGMDDVGEYLLEKIKTAIRWEKSESIRDIMLEKVLSAQQKVP